MDELNQNESDDFAEECCQICLLPKQLLRTSCNHTACQQCLERIFLTTTSNNEFRRNEEDEDDEDTIQDRIIVNCPTRGRCPFCRHPINMFDLKLHCDVHGALAQELPVYEKNIDLKDSDLNDLVFSDSRMPRKTISFKDGVPELSVHKFDGEDEILVRKQRFEEYFYHEKSLTFYGVLQWNNEVDPWAGFDRIEVVAQFSSNYRCIRHGAIIKKRLSEIKFDQSKYPLDGKWRIRHIYNAPFSVDNINFNTAPQLKVVCNTFTFLDVSYELCLDRSSDNNQTNVYFDWPIIDGYDHERQEVESGVDLTANPDGPDVGSVVVWTVTHPQYHRILWKRETKGTHIPSLQLECLGGVYGTRFVVQESRSQRPNQILTYNCNSPCGNVFIQAHKVGLASYHFVSFTDEGEGGVYISYEHDRCAEWPSLDDGSPVPFRVPFVDISYDENTRTFRGKIPWREAYGTTWQGNAEWNYVMVFDTEFTCIVSGEVAMSSNDFSSSSYGETLNYYNAAIVERIRSEASIIALNDDENNLNQENQDILHENVTQVRTYINQMRNRLRNEGTKSRTLHLINQAAIGAIDQTQNPIDYNGMNNGTSN